MRLGISLRYVQDVGDVSDNPYQAPTVQDVAAPAAPLTDAETIRTLHLKHEASLKGAGFLYLLGAVGIILSIVGIFGAVVAGSSRGSSPVGGQEVVMLGLFVLIGATQLFAGWGLRKLRPWAKIPAAILAGISLLSIPIGTLIGAYILYLLFSAKGRVVLSPEYADVVAQTPHLRYRTSRWVWITLIVVVLLIVVGVIVAVRSTAP